MKKRLPILLTVSIFSFAFGVALINSNNDSIDPAEAATPVTTYYYSVSGDSADDLLNSINTKINTNITRIDYDNDGLKNAYKKTDVRSDGKLYDIYSDATNYTPGSAYAGSYQVPGDGYNREHTIPQSWWGGGTSQQGRDLYIVLPSDAKINGVRSNYPYGETTTGEEWYVQGDTYRNRYGSSTSTQYVTGTVFEPFDNRKGDLARIYFYAAAMYWKSGAANGPVTNWTATDDSKKVFSADGTRGFVNKYLDMLLKWHHDDPVSQWEITRNDNVEDLQGNRNPFVDHPSWVDIIWGGEYPSTGTNYENTNGGTASVDHGQISGGGSDPVAATGISLNKNSTSIAQGGSETLTATVTPNNATDKTVSWSVSPSEQGVTVSGGTVSVAANATTGNYTVTATANGGTSVTATCTVTVTESGGGGGGESDTSEGSVTAASGTFAGWTASGMGSAYADGAIKANTQGANIYKLNIFSGNVSTYMTNLSVTINSKINGTDYSTNSYKVEALDSNGNVLASDTRTEAIGTNYVDKVFTMSSGLNGCTGLKITFVTKGNNGNWGIKSASWVATYSVPSQKTLSSISVATAPTKTTYTAGEYFDPTGLVITRTYSDASTSSYTYANHTGDFLFTPSTSTALTTDNTSVSITYGGKSTTQAITVNTAAKTLSSISVSTAPTKTTYTAGEYFDPTGLVITRNYSDSTSDTYAYANHEGDFDFTPSTLTALTTDKTSVTITYGGKSTAQAITVNSSEQQGDSIKVVSSSGSTYAAAGAIYFATGENSASASCDAFGITWNKNGGTDINLTYAEIRVYASHSFMITPNSGYTITSVVITANNNGYATAVGGSSLTNCTKDVSNSIVTLTPTNGESTLGFTNSAQSRLNYVVVNYTSSGSGGGEDPDPTPTSISAIVNKTYYVGETITKSDITVKDNLNNVINDFAFANNNYQFKYTDASSGGALTNKTFTDSITYSTFTCSLTVQVQRQARIESANILYSDLPTGYVTDGTIYTAASGAKFIAYNCANYSSKMQFKASSGYVQNAESLSLKTITINDREDNTLTVYGGNNSESITNTISGDNDVYDLSGYTFFKIARTSGGAAYCSSISVEIKDTPTTLANYIMYEDTTNQCETKFSVAKGYFEGLTKAQRNTFVTSEDYVIHQAYLRLKDWAKHFNKDITLDDDDDYVIGRYNNNVIGNSDNSVFTIIIVSIIGAISIGGYFFLRKKKIR